MKKDITEIKCIVKELSDRPKEKWNTVITVMITAISTALINTLAFFNITK